MGTDTWLQRLISPKQMGEHDLLWGIHAATAWAALSALSLASPGYHRSKRGRNVPSSVRVVASLSPYIREHIRRFGRFVLDMTDMPDPLDPHPLPFEIAL